MTVWLVLLALLAAMVGAVIVILHGEVVVLREVNRRLEEELGLRSVIKKEEA